MPNNNDLELIFALERAKAQLMERKRNADAGEAFAIEHNIKNANNIIKGFNSPQGLVKVQRDLAARIIDKANEKGRTRI